jgi:hypothetical protein
MVERIGWSRIGRTGKKIGDSRGDFRHGFQERPAITDKGYLRYCMCIDGDD